jgi:hypothetical protein
MRHDACGQLQRVSEFLRVDTKFASNPDSPVLKALRFIAMFLRYPFWAKPFNFDPKSLLRLSAMGDASWRLPGHSLESLIADVVPTPVPEFKASAPSDVLPLLCVGHSGKRR